MSFADTGAGSLAPLITDLPGPGSPAAGVLPALDQLAQHTTALGAAIGATVGGMFGAGELVTGAASGATTGTVIGQTSGVTALPADYSDQVVPAVDLVQPPGRGGSGLLEQLQQLQNPAPIHIDIQAPPEAAAMTGPVPPMWFLAMLAAVGLIWLLGMFASRALGPATEPAGASSAGARAFGMAYTAGMATWLLIIILGVIVATEINVLQLWLVYLPLAAAMIACMAWTMLSTIELLPGRNTTGVAESETEPTETTGVTGAVGIPVPKGGEEVNG